MQHHEFVVQRNQAPAKKSGEFVIGSDLRVTRLGYGAMRITGDGIWGEPKDRAEAVRVLRRAVELGINFIDTADSYGPLPTADQKMFWNTVKTKSWDLFHGFHLRLAASPVLRAQSVK
jgi:Aldo/keto reductase family